MRLRRFATSASMAIALSPGIATVSAPFLIAQAVSQAAPDNSAQNKDQSNTADNQSRAKSDRVTTAAVRKAIIADKNLSTYARNVKIITQNGKVTLKGPVKSDDEKQKVAADATGAAPADTVIENQLTVKP